MSTKTGNMILSKDKYGRMVQITALFALSVALLFPTTVHSSQYNRPLGHFTPSHGWMNDPNGMFYDRSTDVWHLYYQYNPNDTVWGLPLYWGHATSKDLITWDHHDPPIGPDRDDEGIFSGSIVVDRNNTSGFFAEDSNPEQRVVAFYTYNDKDNYETQDIAYSSDGGYSFTKYENNPVINVTSQQQRDPKVLWHEESQKWIMVLAKTQEYKVQFYASENLKEWDLVSNFTGGYFGYQYECPGLFKLPVTNPKEGQATEKWVLVLAINPGSPIGGSINQYFIGDFDGAEFKADDTATRFMDIGKDFYAFQSFENTKSEDGQVGLAWASNWQYANVVPTEEWRSSMSLARRYTLRNVDYNPEHNDLVLIQEPIKDALKIKTTYSAENFELVDDAYVKTNFNDSVTGVLDFNLTFSLTDETFFWENHTTFNIDIVSEDRSEKFTVGFDVKVGQYFIDRHTEHPFQAENPFFTERFSHYVEQNGKNEQGLSVFQVYGIIDRNIAELYFNHGSSVATFTFFFTEGSLPANIEVTTQSDVPVVNIESFVANKLTI